MKTILPAAYLKNLFNRVSKCTITQDICTRLLGLLYTFMPQSYNKYLLLAFLLGPYGKLWTEFFPSFYGPSSKRADHENKEGKNEDP